ncbi:MAG: hypothetical protein GX275_13605 [Clostridiales bacterium]|nr:hypothetical protein [Clostridiales bacterium]
MIIKKVWKRIFSLGLATVMSLSMVACGDSATESETSGSSGEPVVTDTLKVGLNADPPTLDPLMSTGAIVRDCNKNIFEGLFEMGSDYTPKLQLAEDYKVNDNYTEYTFMLRKGVKFHNGDEMKADDVVASLNRWLKKNNAVKSIIKNGEQFEKVDDYTVKITLSTPCYLLPSIMVSPAQFPCIMPKSVVDNATDEGGIQEYIGTGPMKFKEWKQNQYLLLEKYDDYQSPGYDLDGEAGDKTIYFKEVYLYFVSDSTIRTAGIQSGEYDIISNVAYNDIEMLSSKTDKVNLYKSLLGYAGVIMNKVEGTLGTNEKLREAITYGIDCDEIMNAAYPAKGYYDVTASMMPEGSIWYTTAGTDAINSKNLEKAKELVKESGYDGTPLKVITNQVYQQHYNGSLVLVDQLKEMGIEVDLQVVDWTTMLEYKKTKGKYDLYFVDYPVVTAPVSIRTISQTDEGWTTWPEFLDLLSKVNEAKSEDDAVKNWEECQKYLMGRSSYVPLGYMYWCNATSKEINNYNAIQCQSIFGCYKTK